MLQNGLQSVVFDDEITVEKAQKMFINHCSGVTIENLNVK